MAETAEVGVHKITVFLLKTTLSAWAKLQMSVQHLHAWHCEE